MRSGKEDADRSRTDFVPGCSRLPGRPAPASGSVLGRIRTCATPFAGSRAIPLHYEDGFVEPRPKGERVHEGWSGGVEPAASTFTESRARPLHYDHHISHYPDQDSNPELLVRSER